MKKIETEGWQVKAIKSGEHTRGYWFTGNLYREARKVASFSEGGNGAQMEIAYMDENAQSDFMSLAQLLQGDEYVEADAVLIAEMVEEYTYVKMIRRDRKKKTYFSVEHDGKCGQFTLNAPYSERVVNTILKEKGEVAIANEVFDVYPDGVEKVYRDE